MTKVSGLMRWRRTFMAVVAVDTVWFDAISRFGCESYDPP
jgi:hypothetical protein